MPNKDHGLDHLLALRLHVPAVHKSAGADRGGRVCVCAKEALAAHHVGEVCGGRPSRGVLLLVLCVSVCVLVRVVLLLVVVIIIVVVLVIARARVRQSVRMVALRRLEFHIHIRNLAKPSDGVRQAHLLSADTKAGLKALQGR